MRILEWRQWWWVVLSLSLLLIFFPYAMQRKKKEVQRLTALLQKKEQEKKSALALREDLQLQINSQNDPNWIELLLIKELGVVPEGWLKVHFVSKR